MPTVSLMTLANGARQFVVHDALEMTWWLSLSYAESKLTPRTTVTSGSVAGAEMTTFLAPASRCFAASSRFVKKPVDSSTTSAPRSPHGRAAGSRSASTWRRSPSTTIVSPSSSTVPGYGPRIESYLSRWASVFASVRSLTATKSMSAFAALAALKKLRPMRPKPLMPTRTAMVSGLLGGSKTGEKQVPEPTGATRSPGVRCDHLDPQAVRVAHVGGVVARTVLGPGAGGAVVRPTGLQRCRVGRVDRRLAARPEGDVPVGRRRPVAGGQPEHGLGDAPPDHVLVLVQPPHPEREEDRVVEASGARQVRDLVADVVDQLASSYAAAMPSATAP